MCSVLPSPVMSAKYKNPCLDLQEYLDIPIFKSTDSCFVPCFQSMKCAEELFRNNIKCISRTVDPKLFPVHELPEVAFLGKSNAGKSSLLQAIFSHVPDLRIRISKKPGATKSLNFYNVGTYLCLVDMPGYGIGQPKCFESSVTHYLRYRKNLVKTFLLIDCAEGFQDWDDAALQMLEDFKIPFAILLTKIDAVKDSQRLRSFIHLKNIQDSFKPNTCFPQVFMLSSHSFEGFTFFMAFLAHITGNLNPQAV